MYRLGQIKVDNDGVCGVDGGCVVDVGGGRRSVGASCGGLAGGVVVPP